MPGATGLTHNKVSAVADSADTAVVQPTNWNDKHYFAGGNLGALLYQGTAGEVQAVSSVATGQVLASAGAGSLPAFTASPSLTNISLGSALAFSGTAPTISSGFGTSPSVVAGTAAAFTVNVGTGGTASSGVIALPTATTGWICSVKNLTRLAANGADQATVQTASSTTTATVQNQTISTGAALAWTASDILQVTCVAY